MAIKRASIRIEPKKMKSQATLSVASTVKHWEKRARVLEKKANALWRASEQCLCMAETIRQVERKGSRPRVRAS